MEDKTIKEELLERLRALQEKKRSHWDKAVVGDAISLIDDPDHDYMDVELKKLLADALTGRKESDKYKVLLNGAENWYEFSWGGSWDCYDYDIAKHYCTPSEFKKVHEGAYRPNRHEEWLDVQTRALRQAASLIVHELFDMEADREKREMEKKAC